MNKERLTVSVSQLNNYIKRVLDANSYLNDIWVKGELSNFKLHSSGHIYASLKDEGAVIKMVMFRSRVQFLRFKPDNGMRVSVRGRISVYERDGVYQIYAEDIVPDGVGSLYAAFEKLKARLAAEELFDETQKKPLPPLPQRIGVVTAKTGAAVRDIINITGRRYPVAEVLLAPVSVQGVSAAPEIANAIHFFNKYNLCDVMIIGRGGGSIEDLWAFNEEIVARAIFESHIPVVSAVGHETDFTIADFVADLRAPTPSAAAELVCPSSKELNVYLKNQENRLTSALTYCIEQKRQILNDFDHSYGFTRFSDRLFDQRQYVDALMKNAEKSLASLLDSKKAVFMKNASKLDALSPLKTLARGFAIASEKESGRIITSVADVKSGQKFVLRLKDGTSDCKFI